MRSFTLSTLLLLLSSSYNHVRANDYEQILSSVEECFSDESATAKDTLACLSAYTECFDESSVAEVQTCVSSSITNRTTAVRDCFGSYITCITTEFQEIIDSLPACMNSSITDLGKCYIDKANTCISTCSASDIPSTNPYESASAASILVCRAFQSDIMDPTCEIVDCCQPCIGEFETFMNCIVQDALNLQTPPPQSGDCEVSCSSYRRLKLVNSIVKKLQHDKNRKLASHEAEKLKAEEIYGLCAKHLETASLAASNGGGGNIQTAIPAELAVNLVEGLFQKCVVEKLDKLLNEYATTSEMDTDSGTMTIVTSGLVLSLVWLGSFLL